MAAMCCWSGCTSARTNGKVAGRAPFAPAPCSMAFPVEKTPPDGYLAGCAARRVAARGVTLFRLPSWMPASITLLASGCVAANPGGGGVAEVAGLAPVFKVDTGGGATDAGTTDLGGPTTGKADLPPPEDADPQEETATSPAEVAITDGANKADTSKDTGADAGKDTAKDTPKETAAAICGDLACAGGESCGDCPEDCGPCGAECGNAVCEEGESCETCAKDCECKPACGNKTCDAPAENCQSCPADCGDCPAICGNNTCEAGETCGSCPKDCPCAQKCGDKTCEKATENCQTCPADCGICPGQCSPITSQGCPVGQQCYPVPDKSPVCSAPGAIQKGKSCNALADCVLGTLCVGSTCSGICDTTNTTPGYACTTPAVCAPLESNGKPLGSNLGACIGGATCNLLSNVGCTAGMACITFGSGKACINAGSKGSSQTCADSNDCLASHVCVNDQSGTGKTCVLKCNAAGGLPKCPAGVCQSLSFGTPPKSAPDSLGGCF